MVELHFESRVNFPLNASPTSHFSKDAATAAAGSPATRGRNATAAKAACSNAGWVCHGILRPWPESSRVVCRVSCFRRSRV